MRHETSVALGGLVEFIVDETESVDDRRAAAAHIGRSDAVDVAADALASFLAAPAPPASGDGASSSAATSAICSLLYFLGTLASASSGASVELAFTDAPSAAAASLVGSWAHATLASDRACIGACAILRCSVTALLGAGLSLRQSGAGDDPSGLDAKACVRALLAVLQKHSPAESPGVFEGAAYALEAFGKAAAVSRQLPPGPDASSFMFADCRATATACFDALLRALPADAAAAPPLPGVTGGPAHVREASAGAACVAALAVYHARKSSFRPGSPDAADDSNLIIYRPALPAALVAAVRRFPSSTEVHSGALVLLSCAFEAGPVIARKAAKAGAVHAAVEWLRGAPAEAVKAAGEGGAATGAFIGALKIIRDAGNVPGMLPQVSALGAAAAVAAFVRGRGRPQTVGPLVCSLALNALASLCVIRPGSGSVPGENAMAAIRGGAIEGIACAAQFAAAASAGCGGGDGDPDGVCGRRPTQAVPFWRDDAPRPEVPAHRWRGPAAPRAAAGDAGSLARGCNRRRVFAGEQRTGDGPWAEPSACFEGGRGPPEPAPKAAAEQRYVVG